ncbi:apoptosis-inducing factor 3-like isoform X2 [Lathamus discolor]|uniref:apoptosis-inducing factor 3-like isoform X2 n=1 Tax=Lathamus discolor TaxID=678569 RepID=UPI0032B6FDD0
MAGLVSSTDGNDTVTAEVCKEADVGDGELWEVMVAGYPVLLVRNKKEFSALSSKCPHSGAPLSKGVFRGERLRCPWHGACFNIRTGDIEEYPSLDCLHCFKVTVEDGKVFVTAKKKVRALPSVTKHRQHLGVGVIAAFPVCSQDLESSLRVKDTSKRCPLSRATVLLLGGGVAALVCAETLRQEGFTGRIVLATKEKHVPYDKSKLTKEMNLKAEDIYMRTPEFLHVHGIELWTEKEAVSVDFQRQKVHFMDGSSQQYNQLLIATGCHSRLLNVPGADLQNVCVLQTPEDSSKILELATGKNLVIIGASFIGMEAAAFLSDKAAAIAVVEKQEFPFQRVLGPQVGGVTMKMLQNKGVKFYMKAELRELQGKDGKVAEAVLASGEKLPADVVVVGIGKRPQWGEGGSFGEEAVSPAHSRDIPCGLFPAVSIQPFLSVPNAWGKAAAHEQTLAGGKRWLRMLAELHRALLCFKHVLRLPAFVGLCCSQPCSSPRRDIPQLRLPEGHFHRQRRQRCHPGGSGECRLHVAGPRLLPPLSPLHLPLFAPLAHANQHPECLRCRGCGLLPCSAAQWGAVQHPSPTSG